MLKKGKWAVKKKLRGNKSAAGQHDRSNKHIRPEADDRKNKHLDLRESDHGNDDRFRRKPADTAAENSTGMNNGKIRKPILSSLIGTGSGEGDATGGGEGRTLTGGGDGRGGMTDGGAAYGTVKSLKIIIKTFKTGLLTRQLRYWREEAPFLLGVERFREIYNALPEEIKERFRPITADEYRGNYYRSASAMWDGQPQGPYTGDINKVAEPEQHENHASTGEYEKYDKANMDYRRRKGRVEGKEKKKRIKKAIKANRCPGILFRAANATYKGYSECVGGVIRFGRKKYGRALRWDEVKEGLNRRRTADKWNCKTHATYNEALAHFELDDLEGIFIKEDDLKAKSTKEGTIEIALEMHDFFKRYCHIEAPIICIGNEADGGKPPTLMTLKEAEERE